MSSTESESEEVAERDQSQRVSFTVNQSTKVSTNLNPKDLTEPSLRKESEEDAETSESLTLTGLDKTEPSSSTKSLWLTHPTRPSEETQESTGSLPPNTSTENAEDLPQLAESTEVSTRKVTDQERTDHQSSNPGREETKSPSEDTDEPTVCSSIFIN